MEVICWFEIGLNRWGWNGKQKARGRQGPRGWPGPGVPVPVPVLTRLHSAGGTGLRLRRARRGPELVSSTTSLVCLLRAGEHDPGDWVVTEKPGAGLRCLEAVGS